MNTASIRLLLSTLKIGIWFFLLPFCLQANNIQIKEPAKVTSVSGGYATIELRLAWDNSWRDAENWDAAYLFLKYRVSGGNWAQVPIQLTGNVISSPYTYMTATPQWTTAPGIFIYRDDIDAGNADVTCKIRWNTGYSREQFENGTVELLAQAIEMVFIPAGGYILGDSLSKNSFADSYGHPIRVQTESSNQTLGYKDDGGVYQSVTVASSYPKGYQGAYVMKYEVTQEQYVTFLNTLTLDQQKALLPQWSNLKEGDYIFGDPARVTNRNGIVMAYHVTSSVPMVFAHNFNPANEYNSSDDGQTLACNYMSIYDLLVYSSWAGLRPMSEMEYEKICRPPASEPLVKGGYAWNGGAGTTEKAQGPSGEGSEYEGVGVGNVNFRNGIEGPLRAGVFAGNGTGQVASGATYWGVMEMSGNVQELCRNVNDWWFYWSLHGEGAWNPGLWSMHLPYYGIRGGSFASGTEELRVSDRRNREYFNNRSIIYRDSTVGFRLARTMEMGAVDLNPGSISALTSICPNIDLTIESTEGASVKGINNMPLRYEWYLNSVKLQGETADTLRYNDWQPGTYYNFVRKVICAIGEKSTNTIRVYVVTPELTAGKISGGTRCNTGDFTVKNEIPALITCDYPIEYTWYIDDVLVTDSLGNPWHGDTLSRTWEIGSYNVVRRATAFGIIKDASTIVNVTDLRLNAGQIYGGQVTETVEKLILSVQDASVGCGNFTYYWLVDSVVVEDEHEAELRHVFDDPGFYQVIRRVISDDSTIMDVMDTVIVNSKSAICGRLDSIVVDDQENVYSILPMADDRCWMTQNMRRRDIAHLHAGMSSNVGYDGDNVRYHEGIQTYDSAYGLHYNWNVAMQGKTAEKSQGICPAGWYIPTDEEWRTLEMAYGMSYNDANALNHWRGTNQASQFKPGGTSKFKMTFSGYAGASNFTTYGYYWTSTTYSGNGGYAYYRHTYSGYPTIYRYWSDKGNYYSVRCIRSKCLGGVVPANIDPGAIKGGNAGVNFPYKIKAVKTASVSCGGLIYSWYINDTLVPGAGASLTHVFSDPGVYKVVRRATADNNIYADTSAIVKVFPACGVKDYVLDDQENRYSIKEMGDARCWMTQNMRRRDIPHLHAGISSGVGFDGDNIKLHEGVQAYDTLFGLHYHWNVAMQGSTDEKSQGICPAGWYIPTDKEWQTLEMAYGMTQGQAEALNAWRGYDEGTQFKPEGTAGFNMTLSGYAGGSNFTTYGYYWTSTTYSGNGGYAYYRHTYSGYPTIYRYWSDKGNYYTVRCIRSMCYESAPQDIDPGTILGGSISFGYPIIIESTKTATVSCGGIEYSWYIGDSIVNGAEGASLTYTFDNAGVYYVTRRATADNGEYAEVTVKVVVYAPCGAYHYVHDGEGNRYSIKEMADGRCWMTQNMRRRDISHLHSGLSTAVGFDGDNIKAHEGLQQYDTIHGLHYIWSVALRNKAVEKAQGICPIGWYIPTDKEWQALEMAYGMTQGQAEASNAWRGYDEGTQFKPGGTAGFNMTLSGYAGGSNFTTYGYYWTSTTYSGNGGYAYYRHTYNGYPTIYRYWSDKANYYSVRCIRSRCEDGVEPDSVSPGAIIGGVAAPDYPFKIKGTKDASVSCGGLYYSWFVNDTLVPNEVGESMVYTFGEDGKYKVVRRATADNGMFADTSAWVYTYAPCMGTDSVCDDQGYCYSIKAMADNRCWMTQNMRRTDIPHMHAGNGSAAGFDGDNIKLHEGVKANDVAYGNHYIWSVAMQGSDQPKAQGICPAGWYIPTDEEWQTLEVAYGMTEAQANALDAWRGYNEGWQLKPEGSAGFNMTLSGTNGTTNFTTYGYYWTSTTYSGNGGYAYYRHTYKGYNTIYRYWNDKNNYSTVRCIRSMCFNDEQRITSPGGIQGGSAGVNYPFTIKGTKTATANCGGLTYNWFIDGDSVKNEKGSSLTHIFDHAGTYHVTRRVKGDNGTFADTTVSVIIYSPCLENTSVYDDQGHKYPIKEMADARCWMTQNIRRTDIPHIHAGGSVVGFDGDNIKAHEGMLANDTIHGCHYIWSVAMQGNGAEKAQGLCPPGWYIPTDSEWRTLERAYGMTQGQAEALDAWRGYNEGSQFKPGGTSGFNLTLSGYAGNSNVGTYGYYWTSTTYSGNAGYAYYRHLYSGYNTVYRYWLDKNNYLPIRCIRSSCYGGVSEITSPGVIEGGMTGINYPIKIKNIKTATVNCGGLLYSWYIDDVLVDSIVASSLTYTFDQAGKYKVTRRATSDDGDYADTSVVVIIYSPCDGQTSVTDAQGHVYDIKEMGDARCWMIQNIRRTDIPHVHAGISNSVGFDGDNINAHLGVQKYDTLHGCHYIWSVAMQGSSDERSQGICPAGWYIPTDAEWLKLEKAYGMTEAQANALDAWRGYNEGWQLKPGGSSGFNLTLSGTNATTNFTTYAYYWTSTTYRDNAGYAYYRHLYNGYNTIYRYWNDKNNYSTVRCIRAMCYDDSPTVSSAGIIEGGITSVGYPIVIKNIEGPKVSCGGLKYSWYVDGHLLVGEVGATLKWTPGYIGTYEIIRRVTVDNDDNNYAECSTEVIVYSPCMGRTKVYDDQGHAYRIKEMADTRCWMTQNIRRTDIPHIHAGGSAVGFDGDNIKLHEGAQPNDTLHGCHYIWSVAMQGDGTAAAQGLCPAGWHVPTDQEWLTLEKAYGMTEGQATALDAWRGYNEGTKFKPNGSSGFNLTLSGYAGNRNVSSYGYYWTSTTYSGNGGYAYYRHLYSGYNTVYRYWLDKNNYLPIRCIRSQCYKGDTLKILSPGKIEGGTVGVNYSITIKNIAPAKVSCGGLDYSWYIDDASVAVPDEVGTSLTYTFASPGRYKITRRVTSDDGQIASVSDTVIVYSPCSGQTSVFDEQGHEYRIKEMADYRCWMTQNMRRTDIPHMHAGNGSAVGFDGDNIKLHEGVQANDSVYGCHYIWSVAMQGSNEEKSQGICPAGWYIPTDAEWLKLEKAYGMTEAQANALDAWRGYNEGWQLKPEGSAGFNMTLSGTNGTTNFTTYGYYWTSTTYSGNSGYAYFRHTHKGYNTIYRYWNDKNNYSTVRCIRATCYDENPEITSAGTIQGGVTGVNYPITIKSTSTATSSCGGIKYSWYIDDVLLSGEIAATLTWTPVTPKIYKIVRRAYIDSDESIYKETQTTVTVYSPCAGRTVVYDAQGNTYQIKEMADTRCWMIQNIRRTDIPHIHAGGSAVGFDGDNIKLHEGAQPNDMLHGCHYQWAVAMQSVGTAAAQGICPPGWHIPTDEEWLALERAYGMTKGQSEALDAWRGYDEGKQFKPGGSAGFNMTLSGYAGNSNVGSYGYYWTSTTYSSNGGYAYYRHLYSGYSTIYRYWLDKNNYLPVRCIRSQCFMGDVQSVLSSGNIKGGIVGVNYPITIKGLESATVNCGGLDYSWYINNESTPIYGEVGASLTKSFSSPGMYIITRRATADNGQYLSASDTVRVYEPCVGATEVYDDQGNKYDIKDMADTRCWMVQNLRRTDVPHYHVGGSVVGFDGDNIKQHEGVQTNDASYGCHYIWSVAMQNSGAEKAQGLCPAGWYVPTDAEWKALEQAYGMTKVQTDATDWRGYDEATQFKTAGNSGFNLPLAGFNGNSNVSTYGYYWTSTNYEGNGGYAYFRHFYKGYSTVYRYWLDKNNYSSLRCIRSQCLDNVPVNLNPGTIAGGKVGVGFKFVIKNTGTATVSCGGLKYTWFINGSLQTGKHGASLEYVFNSPANYTIVRRVTDEKGNTADATALVNVIRPCGGASTVTDAQGNSYSIKEMADTRCWMTQNMRRTDVVHYHANSSAAPGADGSSVHDGAQANDVIYGCHYSWAVAMQGSNSEQAQGICPSGWHIPSDLEWRMLEMAYGMTVTQANVAGSWRGYDEGTEFKVGGSSGLNLTLSGYVGTSGFTKYGYYWTSTEYSGNTGYAYYRHFYSDYATIYRSWPAKTDYNSVRCIKNE